MTQQTFKGLLIDPYAQTVTEVQVDASHTLNALYQHMNCDLIDVIEVEAPRAPGHPRRFGAVVVDDEGLLKEGPKFFSIVGPRGITPPLAGKAVVLGLTPIDGDFTDSPFTLAEVQAFVHWPTIEAVRKFRDGGGFDTRITGGGGDTTILPVRPVLADEVDGGGQ